MKKLAFALIPAGCFLVGAFCNYHNAANARKAAAEFKSFTESMFQNEITASTLNLHYTLAHPEKYGIKDYPITYGDEQDISLVLSAASPTAEDYRRMLYSIPYEDLSTENQITYDILMLALENEKDAEAYALYNEPLGPTLGVQAQLPILLSEYTFSDREDVDEYLALIAQTDTYFSSLLQFEKTRSAAGLFMSDENADAIIRQCRSFIGDDAGEPNLLVTIFNEKLDALSFLTEEEKAAYRAQNQKAVETHVIPAYELLAEGLDTLKGSGTNECGLCYYPAGRAYYEYLIRDTTGSYLPIQAIEARIRQQITKDILACRELLENHPEIAKEQLSLTLPDDPEAILAQLRQKMSGDYPAAPDTDIEVKYVHESLEDFLSPAFYLTPPIDSPDENVIYINNASVSSDLERYTTLAHEGYPGHLYQNLSSGGSANPVRSLFSFGGYTEGWATYVEMDSYAYAASGSDSQTVKAEVEFNRLNRSVMLGISSLLDICIHYHGYTREQTAEFLENLGFAGAGSADAIYDVIIESPANYLKYYLGCLTFMDLRDYCAKNWPYKFDLKDFHRQVLKIGAAPFPVLEKYLKRYYRSA